MSKFKMNDGGKGTNEKRQFGMLILLVANA